jgi:hypothetical protein
MNGIVTIRAPHFFAQIHRAQLSWIRQDTSLGDNSPTSTLVWRHLGDEPVDFDVDVARSDGDPNDYVEVALRIFESITLTNDDVLWTLGDDGWCPTFLRAAAVAISDIDEEFLGYGSLGR